MQHLRDARHRPALNQIEVTWAGALFNALQNRRWIREPQRNGAERCYESSVIDQTDLAHSCRRMGSLLSGRATSVRDCECNRLTTV